MLDFKLVFRKRKYVDPQRTASPDVTDSAGSDPDSSSEAEDEKEEKADFDRAT